MVLVGDKELEWELVELDDVGEDDVGEAASTEVPAPARVVMSPAMSPSTLDSAETAGTTTASKIVPSSPTSSNPRFLAKEG